MKKNFGLGVWFIAVSLVFAYLVAPSSVFATYFIGLGDLPGGITHSKAFGVSADGSVVVGYGVSASGTEAFYWDATNGMQIVTDLIGSDGSDLTDWQLTAALGVSADGNVVVGHGRLASVATVAFRMNLDISRVSFGGLTDPVVVSSAMAASADGSVVVGSSYSQSNSPAGFEAFRWDLTNGVVGLGDLSGGGFYSVANGVSADGSVVVGYGSPDFITGQLREAFRWDLTKGMVGLGFLPGGSESQATGVSADGSVVVGNAGRYDVFRWVQTILFQKASSKKLL